MLGNDEVFCERCQLFRPLEMYKNLLHNPMQATEEEIQSLNERRRKEKQLIIEMDKNEEDDNGSGHGSGSREREGA